MTEVIDDKTMVERVAEAIWAEQKPDGVPGYWDLDFLDQGKIKMIARACIKTMREPTEQMLTAEGVHTNCPMCGGYKEGWQKLIDLALEED